MVEVKLASLHPNLHIGVDYKRFSFQKLFSSNCHWHLWPEIYVSIGSK